MKKVLSVLLSVMLVFGMLPFALAAGEIVAAGECGDQGDNVTWTLDADGVLTLGGTGAMKDYIWNGSPWYQNASVTALVVEEGVAALGNYAFYGCMALEEVSLPETLTAVGRYAFCGCTALKALTLPESVETIGAGAFYGCAALTDVNVPQQVTVIDNYTFCGCVSLPLMLFPQSLETIGGSAFSGCTSLVEADLPETLTTVGNAAFFDCTSLKEIRLPDSVTSVGRRAFSNCTGIQTATLSAGASAVAEEQFLGCSALTSIDVPEGYIAVENGAFSGCSSLTSLTLPAGLETIGDEAFSGCSLTELALPDSVTAVGDAAFAGNTAIADLPLPEALASVGKDAFKDCQWVSAIAVPAALTEIGENAFPAQAVVYGEADSAAQQWAADNNRAFSAPAAAKLTLTGTTVVCVPTADVCGFTVPGGSVVLTVNDSEETVTVKAAADGKWNASLPLGEVNDGDTVTVKAAAEAAGKTLTRELTVLYSETAPAFRSLTLEHNFYTVTVNADDLNAVKSIVTLSEDKPLSFCVKVENSDLIDRLYVVSTKNDDVRKIALHYDASSGCWLGDGYFNSADHKYLPGALSVAGVDTEGNDFDAGVSVKINFLINPAGFAYEAVRSNKLEGVTAAVYYKDEAGRELLWNATSTEQSNPVLTLPDGAFSWAVTRGSWQIRLMKDGYETAATKWMTVPPAPDQVFLPMMTTQAPVVESLNVYERGAEIVFSQYMEIDSVNEEGVVFVGCPGKITPIDAEETAKGSGVYYAKSFLFTPDVPFGEMLIVTVSGAKNYAGIPMEADYSADFMLEEEPTVFTATDAVAVPYGDTAEISLSADNAAGRTVSVSCDGSLLTLPEEEIKLDENGQATVTVFGRMTGKETLTFRLAGTQLTQKTVATVAMAGIIIPGDVDGDGSVTAGDARLALRISVKLDDCEEGSAAFIAADVNRDGTIGSDDARMILRASVHLEELE